MASASPAVPARLDDDAMRPEGRRVGVAEDSGAAEQQRDGHADCREEFLDFLHVVTHDLRSPLANLRGLAAELRLSMEAIRPLQDEGLSCLSNDEREKAERALATDIPETLEHVDLCVSRMDRALNQLVELARLAGGDIELEEVDLAALVARVVESLEERIAKPCRVEIAEDLPILRADPLALEQILARLVANAAQYLAPGRPGLIRISCALDGERAALSVEDNGRGIAQKDMRRIFAPFRRAGKLDTPGEGMGLAVAKALARKLGARLDCVSAVGVGSTFTLSLPLAPGGRLRG